MGVIDSITSKKVETYFWRHVYAQNMASLIFLMKSGWLGERSSQEQPTCNSHQFQRVYRLLNVAKVYYISLLNCDSK